MALDLGELEAELNRTKVKVQDWAYDMPRAAAERKDQCKATLKDQTDKFEHLQSQRTHFLATTQETLSRLHVEEQQLQQYRANQQTVIAERTGASIGLSSAQSSLDIQQRDYSRRVAELDAEERAKNRKLASLRQATELFSQRLGMKFKQGADELVLVMTHIDAFEPAREFSFAVHIVEDTAYQVTKCQPMVEGLNELVVQLNLTTNFSQFVRDLRKLFVQHAQQSHGRGA